MQREEKGDDIYRERRECEKKKCSDEKRAMTMLPPAHDTEEKKIKQAGS
jgi:hypothetical protein